MGGRWKTGIFALCWLLCSGFVVHTQDVNCGDPADIVFVLDGSESLANEQFTNMKKFVVDVLATFDLQTGNIHVGAHTFGRDVYDSMPLNSIDEPFFIKLRIQTLKRPPTSITGTNTHLAIQRMRLDFEENGRAGVKQVSVLITDGLSGLPSMTAHQATLAKAQGIHVIVVGFGDRVFEPELAAIATSKDSIFKSNQFSGLVAHVQTAIRTAICTDNVIATTTPAPTNAAGAGKQQKVPLAGTSFGNVVVSSQQTGVVSYTTTASSDFQSFIYMFLLLIPILVQYMYQ